LQERDEALRQQKSVKEDLGVLLREQAARIAELEARVPKE
jgi:hypothetical protein